MPGKTDSLSELEKRQRQNRDANRKVLQELGLLEPLPPLLSAVRVKKRPAPAARPRPAKKARPAPEESGAYGTELTEGRRRSTRSSHKPVTFSSLDYGSDVEDDDDDDYDDERPRPKKTYTPRMRVPVAKNREKVYGAVPDVSVGTWWQTRLECCADGIHRPTVAGIHAGPDGAYSIALSGGYEDDLDWGDCFTYTGEGGRDLTGTSAKPKNLRTAPQSRDQQLTRGNLALSRNVETRTPVRVIRGYKLRSPYAPEEGYRYDGLYWVEKYWLCSGLSGFLVYKFAMKRCEDQSPSPWKDEAAGDAASAGTRHSSEREEQEDEEGDDDEEDKEGEQDEEATEKGDVKGKKKNLGIKSGGDGKRGRKKQAWVTSGGVDAEKEDGEAEKEDDETEKDDDEAEKENNEAEKADGEAEKEDDEAEKEDGETEE